MKERMGDEFVFTAHAKQRMRQRGISGVVVEWLYRFGEERYTKGAYILFFNKRAMKRLRKHLGCTFAKFESQVRNNYLIICNGVIITVGHRYKRIK